MTTNESENNMTEYETHVVTVKNEQHAYCTCGWVDIWRPVGGPAHALATLHKLRHDKEEA